MDYPTVHKAVLDQGMAPRGGFAALPEDGVPALPGGARACSVVLVGITPEVGWSAFAAAQRTDSAAHRVERSQAGPPRAQPVRSMPQVGPDAARDGAQHPLDAFSRLRLEGVAQAVSACAVFPCDGPPWLAFQRWARRAEAVYPSPLGLLIHPRFGLWHGYRGALLFDHVLERLPARSNAPSPCVTCAEQPCLRACPVDAFANATLDTQRCRGHLDSAAGAVCIEAGCLARSACPIAADSRYPAAQRRFHMLAFVRGAR